MKLDPKQIKGGTLTGNMSLMGTLSLPSLLDDTSSLTGLFIASDNSIKKRSLGTMALLSAASFYDKTTADSTFLKLVGGTISGGLVVGGTVTLTATDFIIRNAARGAGGRALVHDGTNGLSINYANDFTGGVKIGSNVFFSNTASSYLMNVNFGVGTATPSEKLAVVGNISMLGMFKLNAILGTTGQFIKNTGTLSEWANITTSDITGLYLGTKLLMEDTRTSFGNGIYTYRTYNGQTTNNPTGLFYGQILNWGGGASGGQAQVAVGWTPSDNNYIAFRSLRDSADNWYSWKRIYHEGYKPQTADIGGLQTLLDTYVLTSSIVQTEANVTSGNSNAVSAKVLLSIKDTLYTNMNAGLNGKANVSHTHDWSSITGKPTFFDGNYNNLTNKPDFSQYVLTSSIVQTEANVTATNSNAVSAKVLLSIKDTLYTNMNAGLNGKANVNHTHDWSSITGKPTFFDGNYNNLTNKPDFSQYVLTSSIVQTEANVTATNSNAVSAKVLLSIKDTLYANMNAGLNGKANVSHTHDWSTITGKPTFFDGNYNNLSNRPTLFSGSYTDLSNKPVLFDGNYNNLSNKPTLFDGNYNSLINKPTLFDGNYNSLINKPILFDGNYNSLSNLPNLNNFALTANTIPVTPYSGASSNPTNGLLTSENVTFGSGVRIGWLYVNSYITIEGNLNVANFIWCDGGIRGTSLALSNPTTLLDYQVTKTNVEGVYVKVGNNVVKLTLTQFKNLMATV